MTVEGKKVRVGIAANGQLYCHPPMRLSDLRAWQVLIDGDEHLYPVMVDAWRDFATAKQTITQGHYIARFWEDQAREAYTKHCLRTSTICGDTIDFATLTPHRILSIWVAPFWGLATGAATAIMVVYDAENDLKRIINLQVSYSGSFSTFMVTSGTVSES